MIIERFSISFWFALLFAISFSGAVFGVYDFASSVVMFVMAWVLCFSTLWVAYQKRYVKNALKIPADALAILGLIFFLVTLIQYNLVLALIEMLFFLQLALNLHFREHRQVFFGLIACFVALMSGAVYTFDTGYLVYIVLFCIFASLYVAECHIDKCLNVCNGVIHNTPEEQTDDEFNQNLSNNAHTTYVQSVGSWSVLRRLTLVISILLCSTVVYLAMPRFPAGNLGNSQLKGWQDYKAEFTQNIEHEDTDLSDKFDEPVASKETNKTDTDKSIASGSIGADGIVFYAKTNRSRYYQRKTKTYFDGHSWYALQNTYKYLPISQDKRTYTLYPKKANATIDISVAKDVPFNILGTNNTVAIRFPSDNVGRDYYDAISTTKNLTKDTLYQLQILDEYKNGRLVDSLQAPPNDKDLQLPSKLDPRVTVLSDKIVQNSNTVWEKALKLEQHMRTQYTYSLSTLANQNNIPVSEFLFDTKTGHCEYFATSLALLLRTQGIPARMVIGFVGEDYNPITGFYEIKSSHGHAWVDAYVDGVWVTLEGTGAYQSLTKDDNKFGDNSTNDANQQLQDYLENLEKQDVLHHNKPQTLLEQIQQLLLQLLAYIQHMIVLLKQVLPYVLALVIISGIAWYVMQQEVITNKITAYKQKNRINTLLYELKAYVPNNAKVDAQFYMRCLQEVISIQGIEREAGATITVYTARLLEQGLIDQAQASWLNTFIDSCFYDANSNLLDISNSDVSHDNFIEIFESIVNIYVSSK